MKKIIIHFCFITSMQAGVGLYCDLAGSIESQSKKMGHSLTGGEE